jgi:hypothetical protein
MFPSPSLAPPLLSVSASPPLFCGIPDVDDDADEPELEELDAGAFEEVLFEPDEPPPQPATTRQAITRRPAAHRLIEPLVSVVIRCWSFVRCRVKRASP